MTWLFHYDLPQWWRKACTLFLALFWTAGLAFGVSVFLLAGDNLFPLMRGIPYGTVSIVGLMCVTVLPFLFSAFAVYICEPRLTLLICFIKGFLFSFVSAAVLTSFGSAGWLIRRLLMFSDFLSLPLLYFFWLRYLSGERGFSATEALVALSLLILIGSVDYCCISPFLAMLINS